MEISPEIQERLNRVEEKQDLIISLLRKQTSIIDDEYISEEQAAQSFGITSETLRKKVLNNKFKIRTTKPGKSYLYHAGDILAIKNQHSNAA